MKDKRKKNRFNVINLSKFRIKRKLFAFFLVLFILAFVYAKFVATPVVLSNTKAQISSFATKSINTAVADVMKQNINYADIVSVEKDENNNVTLIEANSIKINSLSRVINGEVLNKFLMLASEPLKIPLGTFSGIPILSGTGPEIAYKVKPYGEVFCNFLSSFESAGINQTYHKIFMVVSIKINIIMPFNKIETISSSNILLCESLIVGKIPDVYLNSNALTKLLNLVPETFSSWQN